MLCGISGLVYRRIDGNVARKSTGRLPTTAQPRQFRAINRVAEDYRQKSRARTPYLIGSHPVVIAQP